MRAGLLLGLGAVFHPALAAGLPRSDDGFAPVMRPNENEAVDDGTVFQITWYTTANYENVTVDLVLQHADDELSRVTIADDVDYDQGAYNWTVSNPSDETQRFHIRIVLSNSSSKAVSSGEDALYTLSPPFFIVNDADVPSSTKDSSEPRGLSRGEVAGIAAGCVVFALVALISWWLWRFDKRQKRRREEMIYRAARGSESGASGAVMVEAPSFRTERTETTVELDGRIQPVELPAGEVDDHRPRVDQVASEEARRR